MKPDYDIIIVGGGMVGASLANALPTTLRIAVIEAFPHQTRLTEDFDSRSITLAEGSQRIFNTIGLWSALRSYCVPITQVHVSQQGRFAATRLDATHAKVETLGSVIEVPDLNRTLFEACQRAEHITWIAPATVESIQQHTDRADVILKYKEQQQSISASLLVAADGAQSSIRKKVGIATRTVDYAQTALVANVGLTRHTTIAYERFTKRGPLAMLPMRRQRAALVWALSADDAMMMKTIPDDAFLHQLQTSFGYRLGRLQQVGKRASFPLKLVVANDVYRPRVVLLGNAAHSLHPIAGQGFNLGLRDAAVLAETIADAALAQRDIGEQRVLEAYATERRWDQRTIITLSDLLTRLFSHDYFPATLLRDASLWGVDHIQPIKKLLMLHTMGLAGRLPKLACGIPLSVLL